MLFQPKDSVIISTDPLKNAIPVEQPVVKHRYLRFFLLNKLSVQIDDKPHFRPLLFREKFL